MRVDAQFIQVTVRPVFLFRATLVDLKSKMTDAPFRCFSLPALFRKAVKHSWPRRVGAFMTMNCGGTANSGATSKTAIFSTTLSGPWPTAAVSGPRKPENAMPF